MEVKSIKTHKIVPFKKNILEILDQYVVDLTEGSILAVTSKIVSICEGSVVKIGDIDKIDLIKKQADYYLPPDKSKYNIVLTITRNLLIPTAGIDESNGNGYYILWPRDPQKTANNIRKYLQKKFSLKKVGVVITDSTTTPLRWGTRGVAIAHSGFSALNDYIDKPDIFGRKLKVTKSNIMDALACSAVLVMGEGKEQTPIAVVEDVSFIKFQNRNPTQKEIDNLVISIDDDLYTPLIKSVKWEKK